MYILNKKNPAYIAGKQHFRLNVRVKFVRENFEIMRVSVILNGVWKGSPLKSGDTRLKYTKKLSLIFKESFF